MGLIHTQLLAQATILADPTLTTAPVPEGVEAAAAGAAVPQAEQLELEEHDEAEANVQEENG